MRLAEFALILSPLLLLLACWLLGWLVSLPMLAAALVLVLAGGGAAWWLGQARDLATGRAYVPARLEDGRIVPGHSAGP